MVRGCTAALRHRDGEVGPAEQVLKVHLDLARDLQWAHTTDTPPTQHRENTDTTRPSVHQSAPATSSDVDHTLRHVGCSTRPQGRHIAPTQHRHNTAIRAPGQPRWVQHKRERSARERKKGGNDVEGIVPRPHSTTCTTLNRSPSCLARGEPGIASDYTNQSDTVTAPSQHSHSTVTAKLQHSHSTVTSNESGHSIGVHASISDSTVTAQSQPRHSTVIVQSQHGHRG